MQGGGAARQKCLPGPRQEGGGGSYHRGGATLAREEHTARARPHCPRSRSALPAHPATEAPAGPRRTTDQRFKMSVDPSRLPSSSGWTTALPGLLEVTRARRMGPRPQGVATSAGRWEENPAGLRTAHSPAERWLHSTTAEQAESSTPESCWFGEGAGSCSSAKISEGRGRHRNESLPKTRVNDGAPLFGCSVPLSLKSNS